MRKDDWNWKTKQEARKYYSQPELYQKFEKLLTMYFTIRPIVINKYREKQRRDPRFLSSIILFGSPFQGGEYLTDGTNIRHVRRSGYKSVNKIMSLDMFLLRKFDKNELLDGIKSLIDYEHFFNVVQGKGGAGEIPKIENQTIRREALHFYGMKKFFKEMNTKVIDTKGKNELLLLQWRKDERPLTMVKVIDSTTKEIYLLRVSPDVKTVEEAVASTFDLPADFYHPLKET